MNDCRCILGCLWRGGWGGECLSRPLPRVSTLFGVHALKARPFFFESSSKSVDGSGGVDEWGGWVVGGTGGDLPSCIVYEAKIVGASARVRAAPSRQASDGSFDNYLHIITC